MDFTYTGYVELINMLKKKNYVFSNFEDCLNYNKIVILRHDIDNTLEKALKIARIEYDNGVISTYFVLLSTNFYNIFSKESYKILEEIISMSHKIGLHFDEKRYDISSYEQLEKYIEYERKAMEYALNVRIKTVSMHRPSKWILSNNNEFNEIINSYSKTFLSNFKYLSDSRMHWREDVFEIIENNKFNKLHILTHPYWYSDNNETINEKLTDLIMIAKIERYYQLKNNIRDINKLISEADI